MRRNCGAFRFYLRKQFHVPRGKRINPSTVGKKNVLRNCSTLLYFNLLLEIKVSTLIFHFSQLRDVCIRKKVRHPRARPCYSCLKFHVRGARDIFPLARTNIPRRPIFTSSIILHIFIAVNNRQCNRIHTECIKINMYANNLARLFSVISFATNRYRYFAQRQRHSI